MAKKKKKSKGVNGCYGNGKRGPQAEQSIIHIFQKLLPQSLAVDKRKLIADIFYENILYAAAGVNNQISEIEYQLNIAFLAGSHFKECMDIFNKFVRVLPEHQEYVHKCTEIISQMNE